MDYFYDAQVRRYLTQFMRIMSSFSYKDAKGNLVQVPVRYGDMNRQVAQILKKNSENVINSAPFIACYIKDLQFDRERLQDPSFIDKVNVRERAKDGAGNYLNTQGANYTVERMMPNPYQAVFQADIWTTNTDQKLQIWEQLVVLFNPALEIQTTNNYLDWTSLTYLELTSQIFESRSIPQGVEGDISICTLNFTSPIWITPPAKVKKLGVITKIITSIFEDPAGTIEDGVYKNVGLTDLFAGRVTRDKVVVTPSGYDVLILGNPNSNQYNATLIPIKQTQVADSVTDSNQVTKANWKSLLDMYPGQFTADLSQLRVTKSDGNEVVFYASLNPTDDFSLVLTIDPETKPGNTNIDGSGYINAIINPQTYNPGSPVVGTRYLILENVATDTAAWGTIDANANDIISWDGATWNVIFDSQNVTDETYITNSYTGIQYKWDGEQWLKSFEGVYDKETWRLIL